MSWYIVALKKFAVFQGRARRKEYWYFVLFNVIIGFVLAFIDGLIGTYDMVTRIGFLSVLYSLAVLVPGVAVSVRRLHDTGRSGWWILINFIPIIGVIVFLILTVRDSQPQENQYGPNPKEVAVA